MKNPEDNNEILKQLFVNKKILIINNNTIK